MKAIVNHQRGRPAMKQEDRRSRNLQVRITEEAYDILINLAMKDGVSVSNYVRVILEEGLQAKVDKERLGYYDEF